MKFYKRFPGDIIKKTSGLTMAQFGAYDRLIDWCYANEMPIDPEEVYTITHAMTPADRRDVDRVLAKFFTLTEAGYRQERIEEVIAEALPKIEAARANGMKGGRPVGSGKKPSGLLDGTESEPKAKAIQSQTSSPTSKKNPPPPAGGADGFERFWNAWPKHPRKVAPAQCRKKWETKDCEPIAERIVAHVEAMKRTEQWQKDGAQFIPAPLVYLNQERWMAVADSSEVAEWHETMGGIKGKGKELGIPYTSEDECKPWAQYAARVFSAAGHSPRAAA